MDVGQDRLRRPPTGADLPTLAARWPARAQALLETSFTLTVDQLRAPLRTCLTQFAAQLFSSADRTHRSGDQQQLFAFRERILGGQPALESRLLRALAHGFDRLGDLPDQAAAEGLSFHQLELLDPTEQELTTTLEQLGTRGDARHNNVLYELGHRLAVLIGTPPLEGDALPLGPRALVQNFHQASLPLDLPLPLQVQLLRDFDRSTTHPLDGLYAAINDRLARAGILPQLRAMPLPRHLSNRHAAAATADAAEITRRAEPAASEPIDVLESLRDLLARRRSSNGGASTAYPGERAASTEELQTALGALQQHLGQVTDRASRELRSAARLREELLSQLNIDKPPGAPQTQLSGEQGDTVELVAMLFEQLSRQLQGGSANTLLGNLQLPVLRMAVADHAFFEQPQHPARRLLDKVTAVANEWFDDSDDEPTRALAGKLESLVTRASEAPPHSGLYTTLLADIDHHLALLNRKAQAAERRHVEAAQGRERLDAARARAGELMAQRFAQSSPRGLLRTLLDRAWTDVLALTLLRHGEDSDAFGEQLAITDQLLGRLPLGDRTQLQQDVEGGLQQIGMHPEEATQVAQRLLGMTPADATADAPSTTDLALRLKQHQRLGETTGADSTPPVRPVTPAQAPDARTEQRLEHLQQLPFGTWFEFAGVAGAPPARRKLAWYSPMSGRCLLVTRRGQRGDETTLLQLAQDIERGVAREALPERDNGSLLDRAWRGLTGLLRQSSPALSAEPF